MAAAIACAATLSATGSAWADKIKHPIAVFAGLDKITGRIISFEVAIDETVQFGSLQITPRVCYSRPPTEPPRTDVFAEVDEVDENKHTHRIFTGWMFADSPGMHGIEHPVYDIWLTDCKGGTQIIHEAPDVADAPLPDAGDWRLQRRPGPTPRPPIPQRRQLSRPGSASPSRRRRPRPSTMGRARSISAHRPIRRRAGVRFGATTRPTPIPA